jgi:hypothetical protein
LEKCGAVEAELSQQRSTAATSDGALKIMARRGDNGNKPQPYVKATHKLQN